MSSEYIKSLEEENRALRKRVEFLENTLIEIETLTYRSKQFRVIPVEDIAPDEQSCTNSNNTIQPKVALKTVELNDDDAPVPATSAQSEVLSYLQLQRRTSNQHRIENVPVVSRAKRNAAPMNRENYSANTKKMLKKCKDLRVCLNRLSKKDILESQKAKPKKRSTATTPKANNRNMRKGR